MRIIIKKFLSTLLVGIFLVNPLLTFAQLGDVSVPSSPEVTPQPETVPSTESVTEPIVEVVVPADTTPPVISEVASLSLGLHEATIFWITDELAISRLEYGTTQSYGQEPALDASALLAHTAILTNLLPGTTYYYCIHAKDWANNTADSCGHSFTTAAQEVIVDTTPPDISLVTVTSISSDSATISWTTDKVANAEIEYGTTAGYGEVTPLDPNLALTHSVTLIGLIPNTEYHYRIRSEDQIGNVATSPDNTFTTAMTATSPSESGSSGEVVVIPEQTIPETLLISGIDIVSIASSSVTIAWTTNLPSDSQVEYGDSELLGSETPLSSTLATTHSVTINNLSQNTNYIFRVKSKPLGASTATVAENHEFTTLNHSIPVVNPPNILSVSSSEITDSSATIAWTTDKPATSQVEYGVNTSYGESSALNSTLSENHSVSLTALAQNVTYHYRVKSTDEADNITYSEDYTFTTTGTYSSPPLAVTKLTVGGEDQNSVELVWRVDQENADLFSEYDVRYSLDHIVESEFANATAAQATPIFHGDLEPNGTKRTYVVAGLNPNTKYYFAIRSKHENSSYGGLSNVVSINTTSGASVNHEESFSIPTAAAPAVSSGGGGGVSSSSSEYFHISDSYGAGPEGNTSSSYIPTLIKAEAADSQIIFQWHNPGENNFVRTVIVRKEGSYPESPSDGQTLYEGRSTTFTDTNVQNDKIYYYSLYSYNHQKIYSAPVHVSLAPDAENTQVQFNESGSLSSSTPLFHFVHEHKRGDKDIEIEHLQEILVADEDSYPERYITGYFGPLTEAALKRFQAKHGLAETGVVDKPTQEKLNVVSQSETRLEIPGDYLIFSADLKYGDRGEAVKDLQEFLVNEGSYPEALITGYFGALTRNAVKKFQGKYNIAPVSGYVGYKTRHRMQQLTGL